MSQSSGQAVNDKAQADSAVTPIRIRIRTFLASKTSYLMDNSSIAASCLGHHYSRIIRVLPSFPILFFANLNLRHNVGIYPPISRDRIDPAQLNTKCNRAFSIATTGHNANSSR